ncbi:MAG: hypothetical protein H0V39_07950 [Nitrosomonas sp.]|nr:hypothetical protein [Nitrosomonas sp.]
MLRHIFASCYSFGNADVDIDFLSPTTTIKPIDSGRLSFAFIAQQNENQFFLKINKPGFVRNNIPFSVLCTEACRMHSTIPTFKTYRGDNGQLYQVVPKKITNVPTAALSLFSEQIITLTEAAKYGIDCIPESLTEIPGGRHGQIALMQTLGEYIVKVSDAMQVVIQSLPADIDSADPAGFIIGRRVAQDVFAIDNTLTYLRSERDRQNLRGHIEKMLPNLGQSDEAQAFGCGLEKGHLEIVLTRFNQLEERIAKNLAVSPAQNAPIHNEVKPANVGAIYNAVENRWCITQSFDFDNIAFGSVKNGDHTPLEKDLGRTLSFFSFDAKTGAFYPDNAKATIQGYLLRLPRKLTADEIVRLKDYLQLGVITSYLWRSSYFADELRGKEDNIQLARLDPSIHVLQLEAFDQWLAKNDLHELISSIQNTPTMDQHRKISASALRFRNSNQYHIKKDNGTLKTYYENIDTAHEKISNALN